MTHGDKHTRVVVDYAKNGEVKSVTLNREQALKMGLIVCECGWPPNSHFDFGDRPCAHSDCKALRERGRLV